MPTILALVLVGASWQIYRQFYSAPEALIVYCAHDSTYSRAVLNRFTEITGIEVLIKEDTEATKSLGLVELLVREKANPRCDVFWNNELLGMLQLQDEGVLEPYRGEGHDRIPDRYKDSDGYWTGFGARARVYIVNTESVSPQNYETVESILNSDDLSRTAIAKPMYGTTLTHYSVLWQRLGSAATKAWHTDTRHKNMREVNGNAVTKDLVASGVCDVGFTDTDDFFLAKDAGAPVAMLPVRLSEGATICIPNTVAIIRGTKRVESARELVDYLLSEENELALARSRARQIPLGAVDESVLPDEVREMLPWVGDGVVLTDLSEPRMDCLKWLKELDR